MLAERVGVLKVDQVAPLTNEPDSIGKMLSGLIRSVESIDGEVPHGK